MVDFLWQISLGKYTSPIDPIGGTPFKKKQEVPTFWICICIGEMDYVTVKYIM